MKKILGVLCGFALFAGMVPARAADQASDQAKIQERLNDAADVIQQIMAAPDKGIPSSILAGAACVVVVPAYKKGAFIIGGQYGQGAATCRTPRGWSAPVFVRLTGGSFGWQIGGQSTDLVLVAMNQKGLQSMLKSKFKLGADASVAAGPVGRNAQAATDIAMNAQFLTYSRAKGIFAGLALDGTVLDQNKDIMIAEYGSPIPFETVLHGATPVPENARRFVSTVARYFVAAKSR